MDKETSRQRQLTPEPESYLTEPKYQKDAYEPDTFPHDTSGRGTPDATDHISAGSWPVSSPHSPVSTASSARKTRDNVVKVLSDEPESEFTRKLRLLETEPPSTYAPISSQAEPTLQCPCEILTEDLSGGGLLCSTCESAKWMHYLQCPESFGLLDYGLMRDIRARGSCALCRLIWLAVEQEWKEDGWTWTSSSSSLSEAANLETKCSIMKDATSYLPATAGLENRWIEEGWTFTLKIILENEPREVKERQELLKRMGASQRLHVYLSCWLKTGTNYKAENTLVGGEDENPPSLTGILKVRGEEWADLTKLRERLRDCEESHGTDCMHDSEKQPPGLRLINVNELRVVDAPPGARYFALSYVWGQAQSKCLNATKDNITDLGEVGSLSAESLGSTLAFSIDDAIRVCRELEEEWLWVDCLCIIQDDAEDKAKQINVMEEIYSAAVVTLVAAGGEDANSGLPGVFHWPRDISTVSVQLGSVEMRPMSNLSTPILVNQSIWNTRGWTYQERMLSSRLLYFTPIRASLTCNQGSMNEDGILHPDLSSDGIEREMIYQLNRNDVSLEDYLKIVKEYTSRQLRYRSDTLNAFSGIAKLISATKFASDFLYGLPERYFDQALLWRRSGLPNNGIPSVDALPSWSWASSDGPVFYNFETRIGSIIDWWIYDGGTDVRRINVEKSFLQDGNETSLERYTEIGNDDDTEFHRGRLRAMEQPGRLLFYSELAEFNLVFDEGLQERWLGARMEIQKRDPYRWVGIFDEGRKFVGAVDLPLEWIDLNLKAHDSHKREFIPISVLQERKFWWQRAERNSPWEIGKRMFNVMLIERKDGIVHRVGIGKIYIDDWLAAEPESKVIVLE